MTEQQLIRTMFQAFLCVSIGLLGFMGLAVYQTHVIDQQRQLIHDMTKNPACLTMPTGGNHG